MLPANTGISVQEGEAQQTFDTQVRHARVKAMDFLAQREYSRAGLIKKLTSKGYDKAVSQAAVTRLQDDGLVSDERFIEAFVRRGVNKGHGPVRIRHELEEHQLGGELIQQYLANDDVFWGECAGRARRKRFGSVLPAQYDEQAKQKRFLQYRGFTWTQIGIAMSAREC